MGSSVIHDIQIKGSIIYPYSDEEKKLSHSNNGAVIYSDAKRIHKNINDDGVDSEYWWSKYDDIYSGDKIKIHSKNFIINLYSDGDLMIEKK